MIGRLLVVTATCSSRELRDSRIGILVIDRFDLGEAPHGRVKMSDPGIVALLQCEAFLENLLRNRCTDAAAGLRALDHDADRVLRLLVRREAKEPRVIVLHVSSPKLRRASLSSDFNAFHLRLLPGATRLVHNLPQASSNQFDL